MPKVVFAVTVSAIFCQRLEVLLPVVEAELVALQLEDLAELGRTAEEDGDPTLPLVAHLQQRGQCDHGVHISYLGFIAYTLYILARRRMITEQMC